MSRPDTWDPWVLGLDAALGAAVVGLVIWRRTHPASPRIVSIYEGLSSGSGLTPSSGSTGTTSPSTPYQYTVRSGDTLSGIALCAGTTWQTLAAVNHLSHPNALSVGQVLRLPHPYACETPPGGSGSGSHPVLVIQSASVEV